MKKTHAALFAVLTVLSSVFYSFADTASGPQQGIIHIDGVPNWVGRVVLLLFLFVAATMPMWGDLKEYMAAKKSMRKMNKK